MEVRLAKLHPGALLPRTRSADYSLLAKLHFLVPGGPGQALEETPACTVTFSGGSFSPAVGRGFSKVAAPPMVFFTSAPTPSGNLAGPGKLPFLSVVSRAPPLQWGVWVGGWVSEIASRTPLLRTRSVDYSLLAKL